MKSKISLEQKHIFEIEDIDLYKNAKKFLESELNRLESQIGILEQILDLMHDGIDDAKNFQYSRCDDYRNMNGVVEEELSESFKHTIGIGSTYESILENAYEGLNEFLSLYKDVYKKYLELDITLESL